MIYNVLENQNKNCKHGNDVGYETVSITEEPMVIFGILIIKDKSHAFPYIFFGWALWILDGLPQNTRSRKVH